MMCVMSVGSIPDDVEAVVHEGSGHMHGRNHIAVELLYGRGLVLIVLGTRRITTVHPSVGGTFLHPHIHVAGVRCAVIVRQQHGLYLTKRPVVGMTKEKQGSEKCHHVASRRYDDKGR